MTLHSQSRVYRLSYRVSIRTGPGPVLSLFGLKDRRTGPSKKARTVDTLLAPLRLRAVVRRVGLALSHLPREPPLVLLRVVSVAVGRVVPGVVPLAHSAADEGASVLCVNVLR